MFGKKRQRPQPPTLKCSFCNKSQEHVKKLIAGPNVQICDECVDICVDVLTEDPNDRLRSSAVEGHVDASGRSWPLPGTVLFCGLCRASTTLDQSLAVPDRGILCAGCVGALETALAERDQSE